MQKKTLFVHIGTHKTATTTIQEFCRSNPELFEERGYTYPIFPFEYPYKTKSRNGLFLGTVYRDWDRVRHPEVEKERFREGIGIVHELFEKYHSIVLSDEGLWVNFLENYPSLLQRLMDDSRESGYQVKLIIYLRRQDSFIESWWNQQIKHRYQFRTKFKTYLGRFRYLNYYEILMKFADIVGEENIIVRRFPLPKDTGILQDFLAQVGIDYTEEIADEAPGKENFENVRLYGNTAEIKRVINQLDNINHEDNVLLRDSMTQASLVSMEKYSMSEFSEETRAAFMEQFEEPNRLLAQHFADDRESFFSEDYSGPEKRSKDNPYMINDIIRSSAATDIELHHKILALEKEVAMLRNELNRHQRKLDHLRHPLHAIADRLSKGRSDDL